MAKLDDVSYHIGGEGFPDDAPDANGATHMGMFLRWAIEHDLFADPLVPAHAIAAIRDGTRSPRDVVLYHCDGVLLTEAFTPEGADFAAAHYDGFVADLDRLVGADEPPSAFYEIDDSEDNYRVMAAALDDRWARHRQEKARRAL